MLNLDSNEYCYAVPISGTMWLWQGPGSPDTGRDMLPMRWWDTGAIKAFQHAHVTFYYSADGDIDKNKRESGAEGRWLSKLDPRAASTLSLTSTWVRVLIWALRLENVTKGKTRAALTLNGLPWCLGRPKWGIFQNPDGVLIKDRPK